MTVGAERAPSPTADPERTASSPESSDGPSAGPPTEASRPAEEASTVAERPSVSAGDAAPRPTGRAELAALAEQRLQQSAVESSALLATAREEDASYGDLMAAARALVLNADLRLQSTLALAPSGDPLPGPEGLIGLEDDVSDELKAEIRSLATSSADLADRALQLRPGDAAAELFSTLGTGLRLETPFGGRAVSRHHQLHRPSCQTQDQDLAHANKQLIFFQFYLIHHLNQLMLLFFLPQQELV